MSGRARFSTFGGVFTPCTLTILGVIMFLRFGQVVGHAGVLGALAIVLVSKAITTTTALSLSAVATNTRVKGGGAYFLISRSLGVSFGGSIGVVFFLAQAISVSMYLVGFAEAFAAAFPSVGLSTRVIASAVNAVVFVCVFVGAGWAIKVQYAILAALAASLLSFFAGGLEHASLDTFRQNLVADYGSGHSFFTMFALFFPAATGIMAGANMSGDLKDPARAIPRGTLLAVLVTGIVYLVMAALLGAAAPREMLVSDNGVVSRVALFAPLVTVGIFAATLSSGLGSMMGAPRILQALAKDEVFARLSFFGAGSGRNAEPRRATVLTFAIAQGAILLGDLDVIAPIITMFFMLTYGYLNLATFYESITRNPSYRPTFRFSHWSTALAGAVACIAVMFLVSPLWALASIAAMALLHAYVERQEILVNWGDLRSGVTFERVRKNLLRLEEEAYHPKNWRPSVLALSGGAWARVRLAVYGHWLGAGRGVLTLAQVISGDVDRHLVRREKQEEALRSFIAEEGLMAFPAVLVAPSVPEGIEALVQCYGIGQLRPNVVLLGWSEDPERSEAFASVLETVAGLKRSMVVLRSRDDGEDAWEPPPGPIDVWWRGKANGQLMVLLAHLLTLNDAWRGREIRLIRVVPSEAGREDATTHLERLLTEARVEATVVVLVSERFQQALEETSRGAAVVFLGFDPRQTSSPAGFVAATNALVERLGTVALVWSSGEMSLEA